MNCYFCCSESDIVFADVSVCADCATKLFSGDDTVKITYPIPPEFIGVPCEFIPHSGGSTEPVEQVSEEVVRLRSEVVVLAAQRDRYRKQWRALLGLLGVRENELADKLPANVYDEYIRLQAENEQLAEKIKEVRGKYAHLKTSSEDIEREKYPGLTDAVENTYGKIAELQAENERLTALSRELAESLTRIIRTLDDNNEWDTICSDCEELAEDCEDSCRYLILDRDDVRALLLPLTPKVNSEVKP